jgi:hypothetical protein
MNPGIKSVCFLGAEERSTLHVAAHNCAQDAATWLKRQTDVYRDYVCLFSTVDNGAIAGGAEFNIQHANKLNYAYVILTAIHYYVQYNLPIVLYADPFPKNRVCNVPIMYCNS